MRESRNNRLWMKSISIILLLVLFVDILPYVKAITENTSLSEVFSSEITGNNTESNNVIHALDLNSDMNLSKREKAMYDVCRLYKNAAYNKSDFAKLTMACTYVVNVSEYYDKKYDEIRSAYSSLVTGKSTCHGYARGVQLLLQSVGIKSTIILGCVDSEKINHAWLLVYLDLDEDGEIEIYHCDPLWCDTDIEGNQLSIDHLLMSDEEAKESRTWNYNNYPSCQFGVDFGDDVWIYENDMEDQMLFNSSENK